MTMLHVDLPSSPMTESKLLSCLLVMKPVERDACVNRISSTWFADLWNRRLFNVLAKHRRRDFGQEILDELKSKDGPIDNSPWWVARLLVDRSGETVSGSPSAWREYAYVLEKLYSYRVKILMKLEELKEVIDVAESETYQLCDPAERHEEQDGGDEGQGPGDIQDGTSIG
jgi:hypothetical protein